MHPDLAMLKTAVLLIFLPLSLLGQSSKKNITGIYVGWWGTTQWTYIFDKENTFIFNTAGHFGFTNTKGNYHLSGDTIFIKSFPKEQQKGKNFLSLNDTLISDGDSCIIDLAVGYDYCKGTDNKSTIHPSRQRIKNKSEARKPDE